MKMDPDGRGIANEAMVEQALEIIKENPRDASVPRITGFVHATRHSELDRSHVDFLIDFENGDKIPLQVKSSERHARRFERLNKAHRHFIPVIVVKLGETLQSVINKVIGCIRYALKRLKRATEQKVYFEHTRRKKKRWFMRFHAPSMCH
jgi:hypothetical protein